MAENNPQNTPSDKDEFISTKKVNQGKSCLSNCFLIFPTGFCCAILPILVILVFFIGIFVRIQSLDPKNSSDYANSGTGNQINEDCITQVAKKFKAGCADKAKDYVPAINEYAQKYNVDPALVAATIHQESGWCQNAISPVGAIGLMQLMPLTAVGLGVNPLDANQNIKGGTKYTSQNLKMFNNNLDSAIAAYNAGPGAVQKYGGVPPYSETQNYVKLVKSLYTQYKKCLSGTGITNGPCFYPLPSQYKPSYNFKEDRPGRYHAGIDIGAPRGTPVYAIADGIVVNDYIFTDYASGSPTHALFVNHGGIVVNYGEVESVKYKVGNKVKGGEQIASVGQVSSNSMLHFETYTPGTTTNISWYKGQPQPKTLLDPTNTLKSLQAGKCPSAIPTSSTTNQIPCIKEDKSGECGIASSAMLIAFYSGNTYTTTQLHNKYGMSLESMLNKELGSGKTISWGSDYRNDWSTILNTLDKKNPVIIKSRYPNSDGSAGGRHYMVLTGYEKKDGKIIFNINNPSPSGCQKDQKVSQDFFNNNQSDEGYLYGIVK